MSYQLQTLKSNTLAQIAQNNTISIKAKQVLVKLYTHKFKVIFFIFLLYLIKKGYGFYKAVKPYLSLIRQFNGGGQEKFVQNGRENNNSGSMQQIEKSESQKQLERAQLNVADFKQLMKLFKSAIKSINTTIHRQPQYLNETLISRQYNLDEAMEQTKEKDIDSQTKLLRWEQLKVKLIQSAFSQVYLTRIIQLISTLQLSLTGRNYRLCEKKLKDIESNKDNGGSLMELIQQQENAALNQSGSDFDPMSDSEQPGGNDLLSQTQEQKREKQKQNIKDEQKACQDFVNKFYLDVITPLCENTLIQTIGDLVEHEINKIKIKSQVSMPDLVHTFDKIHNAVLDQFFLVDISTAPNSVDLNESFDSYESSKKQGKSSWIIERLVDQYNQVKDKFAQENRYLKKIGDEFIDFLQSENYFEQTLCSTLDESYSLNLRQFLQSELSMIPANPGYQQQAQNNLQNSLQAAIIDDGNQQPQIRSLEDSLPQNHNGLYQNVHEREEKVLMVMVVTKLFNIIHSEDLLTNQLKDFYGFKESQQQIDQMIVLVYFQDKNFFGIEIKDMLEAAEQRGDAGSLGISDLLKSLTGGAGGGNGDGQDDFLMKMLSSFNEE
eukprot:403338077